MEGGMTGALLVIANFDLKEILGSASAAIGIIIAGAIFLSFLSGKYAGLLGRYSQFTGEYRSHDGDGPRHGAVRTQISFYHRRLWLLGRATWCGGAAMLSLLIAVLAGALSIVLPHIASWKWIGSAGLFLGLGCMGIGVFLDLWENILARHEIGVEVADLDDEARNECESGAC